VADTSIKSVRGRQILDSRGRPTVEVDVELADGSFGRASVPSGASTGTMEAHELRDNDPEYYDGRGVLQAVVHVNDEISRALINSNAFDQASIDQRMLDLDATPCLNRLGANAILAVSLAVCRSAAASARIPLYARIAELFENDRLSLPLPMVNILSGGLHTRNGMDVQDFLVIPASAHTFAEALHLCARVRIAADLVSAERGHSTLLADEGGLSPALRTGREALEMMMAIFERANLKPNEDALIAIDLAATTLRKGSTYEFAAAERSYSATELIDEVEEWARDFPVVSVEDALGEDDWTNWTLLTDRLGKHVQLVGDDLFATNLARVQQGVAERIANAVLIKLNQNGTLSGTLEVLRLARNSGYATVVSARSGETDDSFIADLAVGTNAGQIKIGSLRGLERLTKYNQLLRIEEETNAPFVGISALGHQQLFNLRSR
jgi:enolase